MTTWTDAINEDCVKLWLAEGGACPTPEMPATAILRARRFYLDRQQAPGSVPTTPSAPPMVSSPVPPPDPYLAQREREASPEFRADMQAWNDKFYTEYECPRREARCRETLAKNLRHRVVLGLDCGPDPRLLLSGDFCDPSRRLR